MAQSEIQLAHPNQALVSFKKDTGTTALLRIARPARRLARLPPPPPSPPVRPLAQPTGRRRLVPALAAEVEEATRAVLLAQRDAIANWPLFSKNNNLTGWDDTTPVCQWGGITCGMVSRSPM